MTLADWGTISGMTVAAVTVIGALVGWLERRLNQMERVQGEHAQLTRALIQSVDHKVMKLDGDVDGLTQQFGTLRHDNDRRFLPRDEHAESVRQLREAMADLTQTMRNSVAEFAQSVRDLSRQMFDLARAHGAQGTAHDPDRR